MIGASALLLAFTMIPGSTPDLLGFRIGGISDMRYDPSRRQLFALADRGPGDGTVPYEPRIQVFDVTHQGETLDLKLARTILLTHADGLPFTGLVKSTRPHIDSEGLAIGEDGSLYVADEYAPYVYHFDFDGRLLGWLAPPEHFLPQEGRGRIENRGFEGLCITPGRKKLAALLQSPLAQDGGKSGKTGRLLIFDLENSSSPPKEYAVPMPDAGELPKEWKMSQKSLTYNAIEAISEDSFLLLARDDRGRGADPGDGDVPVYKRILRLDLKDGKAEVSPYLDLLDVLKRGGMKPEELPVKFESLAWGGDSDGAPLLWTSVDNDFDPKTPTYVFLLRPR